MQCPIDQHDLQKQDYEGVAEVDICPHCSGVWLDKGELEAIQDTVGNDYIEEMDKFPDYAGNAYEVALQKKMADITCPSCSATLERKEYAYTSQIMIDKCPSCHGIWLDKGELQALEIFFEKSRLDTRDLRKSFWVSLKSLFS
jgi:Zn-finger nucleic acid-binding protein